MIRATNKLVNGEFLNSVFLRQTQRFEKYILVKTLRNCIYNTGIDYYGAKKKFREIL